MFRGFYYVIVKKLKIGKVNCKNLVNLDVLKYKNKMFWVLNNDII